MFEIFTKTSSKEKRGRNLMQKLKKKLLKREKLNVFKNVFRENSDAVGYMDKEYLLKKRSRKDSNSKNNIMLHYFF